MIKKLIFIIVICMFFTGCTHRDDIVIRFSSWGSGSETVVLNSLIKEFEAQNPEIKIEFIHIPQNYFQKLHLLFASNLAPDVVFINNLNLPVYSDYLEDLSEIIDIKDFYPKSVEGMKYNGKLLAVPRDISTLVIYYNKTLFKKYGISYPEENWTLDELLKKALFFKSKNIFGISYEPLIYYAQPYMNYYGGGILDEEYKFIANNEQSLKGINFYKDLAYKYHVAPMPRQTGSRTLAQIFLEGRMAMHLSGRWLVPKYRSCADFDWDIVNFPSYTIPCDISGWSVTKSSSHKDAAIKFVRFLSNKNNIAKMAKGGLIVPARIDVSQSPEFLNGKPEHSYLFLKSIKYSKTACISKDYSKIIDKLNDKNFNFR